MRLNVVVAFAFPSLTVLVWEVCVALPEGPAWSKGLRRCCILALIAGAVGSPAVAARTLVEKPELSLSLPEGWVEIPSEVLVEVFSEVDRLVGSEAPRYEYGFQLEASTQWLDYPYVLVKTSAKGRLPEHKLRQMARLDANALVSDQLVEFEEILQEASLEPMRWDPEARVVWTAARLEVADIGTVKSLSGLIPTEQGMVQIHGYARSSDFERHAPAFREMVLSASIAPALAYQRRWYESVPVLGALLGGDGVWRYARSALIGMVAVLVIQGARRLFGSGAPQPS